MMRIVICLLLVTHALSGLSVATNVGTWLDADADHVGHELHAVDHDDSLQHDESDHHFCHHNLVDLASRLAPPSSGLLAVELRGERPLIYSSAFPHRLLRPPRA